FYFIFIWYGCTNHAYYWRTGCYCECAGKEIVNTYLFGMGIMGFMTPTGLILPSLALSNVSLKAWWKFIYPLLLILFLLCSIFLIIGIYL
ncbi:MAG TPA: hypothetical protein VGP55_05800, partial [Chitinophagaceae bacterium]|nr:hypothetical protein [Chitinophagaceae bacterium]